MEPTCPLDNAYETERRDKIAANKKRLEQLGIPVARQLFDHRAPPCIRRPRARRAVQQQTQRCSDRLVRLPKPKYVEALPSTGTRARLLLTIRGDTMSTKPPKPSGTAEEQHWLARSASVLGFTKDGDPPQWTHRKWPKDKVAAVVDFLEVECIDLDEMRGKPEKSFNRITEALTEKFPQPLGMLNDMLTQIEELMETSKTSSKRKTSSSGTTEPKAKKPKQQRVALNEAATAMHAELRAMGFTSPADFGKVKWEDFKTDSPTKVDSIVQARQQVYANFHMREDRLVAINILATHWRNQRKTFVKRRKELASAETGSQSPDACGDNIAPETVEHGEEGNDGE